MGKPLGRPKKKSKLTPAMIANKWKPGQTGNPEGARRHNPISKALKKLTIDTYREVIEIALTGNLARLEEIVKDENSSAIQVGIATALGKAIKAGDYDVVERLAERIVGKIPDEVHVKSSNVNTNLDGKLDPAKLRAALAKLESDF